MKVMSDNEMRCFKAAMKWQRRDLRQALFRSLIPRPPFIKLFYKGGFGFKLFYLLLAFIALPLLLVFWFLRALVLVLLFPHRYFRAFLKPGTLKGPGERNLQGIHNAFSRHLHLSAENYILCFNDWIAILYGEDVAQENRIENFVSFNRMHQSVFGSKNVPDTRMRNALSMARETLSRKLGYY